MFFLWLTAAARADVAPGVHAYDVEQARQEASRFVAIRNASPPAGEGFTRALVLERFYRIGDRWRVAMAAISHGQVSKHDGPGAHASRGLDPAFFDFRVVEVQGEELARIEVTPAGSEEGFGRRVRLTVNGRLKIVSKEIFHGASVRPVVVSFEGSENAPSGFDSFPVELPALARFSGAETLRFETVDLLGRKLRATWRKGDLWPSVIESNAAVSTLVAQEKK